MQKGDRGSSWPRRLLAIGVPLFIIGLGGVGFGIAGASLVLDSWWPSMALRITTTVALLGFVCAYAGAALVLDALKQLRHRRV